MTTLPLALAWVTAVGTLLAALVPGVLFFVERRHRKSAEAALAAERADRAEAEKRRTEEDLLTNVRRVVVWGTLQPAGIISVDGEDHTRLDGHIGLRNQSSDTIFNVLLLARRQDGITYERDRRAVLVPGVSLSVQLPRWGHVAGIPDGDSLWPHLHCSVQFTDMTGRRWERHSDGRAVRLDAL